MNSVLAWDSWLFQQINGFVGTFPLFDRFIATMVNEYFITVTMSLILLALWFVGGSAEGRLLNQKAVVYALLAEILANGIVKFSNLIYFRPRPFAAMPVKMLFYEPTDSSMPSNPAAVGFAFATGVWLVNRRAGVLLYALAILLSFARVYSGVHYPLDVVSGALIGIIGGLVAVALGRQFLNPVIEWIIGLGRRIYLA
jgi:undecaprenyl-diphosphatase